MTAILGTVEAGYAIGFQFADFLGRDDAAPAAKNLDVAGATLPEQVHHVLEVLDVATLVAGDRDALGVLLDGGLDDVLHGAVVAQVDDLAARGLEDAAHDVDAGVVAIEETGGGDETDLVPRQVACGGGAGGFGRSENGHGTPDRAESQSTDDPGS